MVLTCVHCQGWQKNPTQGSELVSIPKSSQRSRGSTDSSPITGRLNRFVRYFSVLIHSQKYNWKFKSKSGNILCEKSCSSSPETNSSQTVCFNRIQLSANPNESQKYPLFFIYCSSEINCLTHFFHFLGQDFYFNVKIQYSLDIFKVKEGFLRLNKIFHYTEWHISLYFRFLFQVRY